MLRILNVFRNAVSNRRGNVTAIVGLSAMVILPATIAGIDAGRVVSARAHLQDAADTAAIAAALDPTGQLSAQSIAATKAFDSNIDSTELEDFGASGVLTTETANNIKLMKYAARADVPTYILGLIGKGSIEIHAVAKAGVTINSAEIAFVLDNTGSMGQNNKMEALKTSLDTVLASLTDATGKPYGNTKVALVPFDTQVALSDTNGMTGYASNFTSVSQSYSCSNLSSGQCSAVTDNYDDLCDWVKSNFGSNAGASCASNIVNYTRSHNGYYYVYSSTWFNNPNYGKYCYNCGSSYRYLTYYRVAAYSVGNSTATQQGGSARSGYYTWDDGALSPSSAGYNNYSKYTGAISYAYPNSGGYGSTAATIKDNNTITANDDLLGVGTANWSGCVIDRKQPYDVQADGPDPAKPDTLYPAAKCATNTLLPIMPLTTDIAAVRTYAAKMKPAGNTNVTIGIQWGMEVLSPEAPFQGGAAFTDPTINKYMIVLTDGQNTQNRWTTSSSQIDARMIEACKNAKAKGITVFTIRLEAGNSAKLEECASNKGYYYNLSNANQLSGTLGSIMKSIRKIRLVN